MKGQVKGENNGIALIAMERVRQVTAEGYSSEHDDRHSGGELAIAAACYASPAPIYLAESDGAEEFRFINPWPFDTADDFRMKVQRALLAPPREGEVGRLTEVAWRVKVLSKAGALIAAEIDRLLRCGDSEVQ